MIRFTALFFCFPVYLSYFYQLKPKVWIKSQVYNQVNDQINDQEYLSSFIPQTIQSYNRIETKISLSSLLLILSTLSIQPVLAETTLIEDNINNMKNPRSDNDLSTASKNSDADNTVFTEDSTSSIVSSNNSNSNILHSDEYSIHFTNSSLGLSLTEINQQGFPLVIVKSILDENLKENKNLRPGAVIVSIGMTSCAGLNLQEISNLVKLSSRPLNIIFRDPTRFFELLDSTIFPASRLITTQYLPANTRDKGSPEQVIKVERLQLPPREERNRASQTFDVMEIQYVAQVLGQDRIVDSSAERAPPGTSTKSIYYILGEQNGPPGKFPTGWDLTLRGMVVGEKRRITLPYSIAYGSKGLKDRKIPPFATLVYTVKLVSLT